MTLAFLFWMAIVTHDPPLADTVGRNEIRVDAAPFVLFEGATLSELLLPQRLEQLGYQRVHHRPTEPGTYFWGHDVFWIFRRAHRLKRKDIEAQLFGLILDRGTGRILGGLDAAGSPHPLDGRAGFWLEGMLLAESFEGNRAARVPVRLDALPDYVWQAVLAAEDARFFEHSGVDGRAVARALLANVKRGRVVQGGSTITQQLIKNRDLTPKRSLGRKLSESVRALALESRYDKKEILEAYLNAVYMGHVGGMAIHGFGAAARYFFSKPLEEVSLSEACVLAALVQGPNRYAPHRHPEAAELRRDWVLERLGTLGWLPVDQLRAAAEEPIRTQVDTPSPPLARHFLGWLDETLRQDFPRRVKKDRGFLVQTTLDAQLQASAEQIVGEHLAALRRGLPKKAAEQLSAALVCLDAGTGEILAYVGGDPANTDDAFDRVRRARRHVGSAIKPFLLLHAFTWADQAHPVFPGSRILDAPLTLELPSGDWSPENDDARYSGVISLRTALVQSRNVPFVRLARYCGFDAFADQLQRLGFSPPAPAVPSMALGAFDATPMELARAFEVFAVPGRSMRVRPWIEIQTPAGHRLKHKRPKIFSRVDPASAYLVVDVLLDVVRSGTGKAAQGDGWDAAGKTGTSSDQRDAWFVGCAGNLVSVVWVGCDDGHSLGRSAGQTACPIWRDFMNIAVPSRPKVVVPMPPDVRRSTIDPRTGRRILGLGRSGPKELFRTGAEPPRDRLFQRDEPLPVIE